MKVLLTGASGFLGKYLLDAFQGISLLCTSRSVESEVFTQHDWSESLLPLPSTITCIVHAAGQAHIVPKTRAERQLFVDNNILATENLIHAASENEGVNTFIFISTVAVYGKDSGQLISEDQPPRADDPYGSSKAKAERIVKDAAEDNGWRYYILRLPLLVGENPPGNLGRMLKSMSKGTYFRIGKGSAQRSVVLARDVAQLCRKLCNDSNSYSSGVYNVTDGEHPTFLQLEDALKEGAPQLKQGKSLPKYVAASIGVAGSVMEALIRRRLPFNRRTYKKLTKDLTFSDAKAREHLGWNPASVLEYLKQHNLTS